MSECLDCTQARATRWHGGYRIGCPGCAARAVARSQAMLQAMRHRSDQAIAELRETISNAMPHTPWEEARASVTEWWRRDRQQSGAKT